MSNKANRTLCFRVEQLLVDAIKLMPEGFPIGELKLFFMSNYGVDNPSKLNFADFKIVFEKAEFAFSLLLRETINDATKEWRHLVRGELSKGGGVLFKYISKEEKHI